MTAESPNTAPRRRKAPPRRTPAIIEQRPPGKPVIFGWGADLDRREREALKERIALFSGIAIAVVLALLLGWGWYHDNVSVPAAKDRVDNQVVAIVGNNTIHYGFYTRLAQFQKKQADSQMTTLQQQQATLQANPKKNAAQLAQINAQVSGLQQQLGTLPTSVLNNMVDNETMFQRAGSAGVTLTSKDVDKQMTTLALRAGGKHTLQTFISNSGLSHDEFMTIIKADVLRQKLSTKLGKETPHTQSKVHAAHILVSAKKKALAQKLYQKVLHGANFAALAKKNSIDKGSAINGGDLPYAVASTYVAPFAKAVSTMNIGSIQLVKSQFGWHIIKLLGRKHVKLTSQEYRQAQQSAFTTWLQKQQGELHVQRIMDVTKIPGLVSPGSQLPLPGQIPGQGQVPQPVPVPAPGKGSKGNSGTTPKK